MGRDTYQQCGGQFGLAGYLDSKVVPAVCWRKRQRSRWGFDMSMNRHRHAWRDDDICASCGAQRCHATQLRSAIMLQSGRCRRATQEGSHFCRRHRYLDHVQGKRLAESLQLQTEAKAS